MKLKQWIKVVLMSSSVLALVACSSAHKKTDDSAVDDANAAYNGAQTAGLGEETSFGDQAGGSGSSDGQRVRNGRVYYFDYDSNVVQSQDRAAIESNGNYLLSHANAKVMLEGHTDPRGSREYNIGLGERRAKAVAAILTAKGVSPAQIRIVSYGAEKLAAPGHTEADYQLDRRVVLVYLQR